MTTQTRKKDRAELQLRITHLFDAPRELVWDAWTKVEHLSQWWGPEGFTNTCDVDLRPGGSFRIDMKGPDGKMFPAPGTVVEVREYELLAFSQTPVDAAGNGLFEVLQTVVFGEQGSKTLLTLTAQVVSTTPAGDEFLADLGESWATVASRVIEQSLGKLERRLDMLVSEKVRP